MLRGQHDPAITSRYGSQDLQIESQATAADRALKEETANFLPTENRNVNIKSNRRQVPPGGKLIAQSGKDFVRAHARHASEIHQTERKKPSNQAKYASALGVYTTAKRNKHALGTIDVTSRMDKMPHYELSPKHLAGGQNNLLSDRSPGRSLERMTVGLIKAEGSEQFLK
jgi:hypothetical protein